jgi:hypothetical protein
MIWSTELTSGKQIYLDSLDISKTYAGLLCGEYTPQVNKDFLHHVRRERSNATRVGLFT